MPDGISSWNDRYIPTAPAAAPRPVEIQSIRLKESDSIRATTAGMTSVAATSVTPMIFSVARIDTDSTSMSSASMRRTLHAGHVGDLGVEGGEQERPVEHGEDGRGEGQRAGQQQQVARPRRR